jgi:hypothetical protein
MYIGHPRYMAEMCGKSYPQCVQKMNVVNVVSMWDDHVETARARGMPVDVLNTFFEKA